MLENSVVRKTGQLWLLALSVLLMLVGSLVPLWPSLGMSWTVGTVVAVAGYALGLLFVRCPGCRNRWFWSASLDATLYGPLLKQPVCPSCKRDFSN